MVCLSRISSTAAFVLAVGGLASGADDLHAQQPADSLRRASAEYDPLADVPQTRDPCIPADLQESWIDWLNRKISRTVCGSAMWFDGFFGDATVYDENDATYGRIFAGLWWDDRGGFDPKFKFRVKAVFPQLKNRFNVRFGRESVDNFVTAGPDGVEGLPQSLATSEEEEWFLGLGFAPFSTRHNRLHLDVGARLNLPPDPYARLHYRQNLFIGENQLARFRETLFWERRRGFGASTRLDFDWRLGERLLTRLFGVGTFAESVQGLEWQTGVILYSYVGPAQAVAIQADIRGETGREVPILDYGLTVVYRRKALRPWLFTELSAGVSWPREVLEEERKINPGVGFGFEMYYGARHRSTAFHCPRVPRRMAFSLGPSTRS